jgi:hypothetical protein
MPRVIMTRTAAIQLGLSFLAGLLFLLALPLAFLALISLGKLLSPTDLNHMTLEFLLVVGTVAGLLSPLAFISLLRPFQIRILAFCTVAVAVAIAALFSPLYRGFIH